MLVPSPLVFGFAYDAASMGTSRRLIALSALAVALLGACSGGGGNGGTVTPQTSTSPTPPPTETISQGPSAPGVSDVYRYQNAGLVATLDFGAMTLAIENGTGRDLPKPDFYVLDARDGHRIDGKVLASAPVSDGQTATFDIQVPPSVDQKEIGLVVLLMGSDNYGAFVRQ